MMKRKTLQENELKIVVGVDLGATTVRAGVFTPQAELLVVQQTEIKARRGPEAGLQRIIRLIEQVLQEAGQRDPSLCLLGIGVGSTGPTDARRGVLVNPLTLPGWLEVPVIDRLKEHFGVPACLENDADAAALGEYWAGAAAPGEGADSPEAPGVRCLYAITVGTGIGTACILDGQVYRGANGFHPEGGHQIVDPSGPTCYCGGNGCWESMSSGTAIGRAAREALQASDPPSGRGTPGAILLDLAGGEIERVDSGLVAEAAHQGDPLAVQVIERAAEAFATGVFNILMLFQPEMIVLSGGVMRSLELFKPAIERVILAADAYIPARQVRILPAALGYYAGLYGAAYAILQKLAND
jgi:glucokinase